MTFELDRVAYQKPVNYNKNVKIGNWFEENQKYKKQCFKHASTYSVDYVPKEFSKRDVAHLWNNKFMAEGLHPRIIRDHQGQAYLENYSTLYDLAYNHFPRCIKGPVERVWRFKQQTSEPEIDFALNYGNITSYGLLEAKREKWRCETIKYTPTTHYEDTFLPPRLEDLKFKRHGIPLENSSIMMKQNTEMLQLKLRGEPLFCMPDNDKLVVVPREPRCNPITWECPDSMREIPVPCVEQKSGPEVMINTLEIPRIPYDCIMNRKKFNY